MRYLFGFLLLAAGLLSACQTTTTSEVEVEINGTPNAISWAEAQNLILSGQVEAVSQSHALQVTLDLKDGRQLFTIEPNLDDVLKLIQQCGDPCVNVVVSTE